MEKVLKLFTVNINEKLQFNKISMGIKKTVVALNQGIEPVQIRIATKRLQFLYGDYKIFQLIVKFFLELSF